MRQAVDVVKYGNLVLSTELITLSDHRKEFQSVSTLSERTEELWVVCVVCRKIVSSNFWFSTNIIEKIPPDKRDLCSRG